MINILLIILIAVVVIFDIINLNFTIKAGKTNKNIYEYIIKSTEVEMEYISKMTQEKDLQIEILKKKLEV